MKRNNKIIGLTGGIASGKSTVADILEQKGFKVIDADSIARQIVEIGRPAYKEVVEFYGSSILNSDRTINRKSLGDMVFSSETLLEKINSITHPYIYERIREEIRESYNEDIIFIDIPLLFEELDNIKKHNIYFDEIWLIYADEKTQLKRLISRSNLNIEDAKKRIQAQIPIEDKRGRADRVINNNSSNSIESLRKKIEGEISRLVRG